MENMKKVSVNIPNEYFEKLREEAKENDIDISKLLRLIIKIYLE